MNALLLSAGFGKRLRPITDTVPKCLVKIGNIPLLQIWLDKLASESMIDKIYINTHYLRDQVEDFVCSYQSNHRNKKIELIHEKKLLGTAGTVKSLASRIATKPLFFAHADNLSLFSFRNFVDAYLKRPLASELTMMTFNSDNPQSCGLVEIDEDQIVTSFQEKPIHPKGNLASAATFILSPQVIKQVSTMEKVVDFSKEILPLYVERMNIWHNDVYHRDIGTPHAYKLAHYEFFKLSVDLEK